MFDEVKNIVKGEEVFHRDINNLDQFTRLVGIKNGASPGPLIDTIKRLGLASSECPIYPAHVFGITKACHTAKGVRAEQSDPSRYVQKDGARIINRIPFPDLTVRLTDTEMQHDYLIKMQLPTELRLKHINDITHPEYALWYDFT